MILYEILRIISWNRVGWNSCESTSLECSVVGFEKVVIDILDWDYKQYQDI